MTRSSKGELAVAKMRHSYTMRHGPTECSYTYVPMIVEKANLQGRIIKARDGWNSPVSLENAPALYAIPGTKGADLLPKLEREYDDFESCRAAIIALGVVRSEG